MPTEDPPQDYRRLLSDIKGFLNDQIETLSANIDLKIKNNQEKLAQNLSHHLSFIDEKLSQKAQKPVLKSIFNNRHWDRTQRYRTFIQDAKYHLEAGCTQEAIACMDACDEACKLYQADIVLADKSEAGWELVERLGQDQKERLLKKERQRRIKMTSREIIAKMLMVDRPVTDRLVAPKIGHHVSGAGQETIPTSSAISGRRTLKAGRPSTTPTAVNGSVSRNMAENSSFIYNRYSYKFSNFFLILVKS